MKASALKNSSWLLVAMFASLVWLVCPQKSLAADGQYTCYSPVIELATGKDGGAPRVAVKCTGGSTAPGITWFAFRISDNPTVANMIPTMVGDWVEKYGPNTTMTIFTDLNDLSGGAWGCGTANCRTIYYLYGF
jgi:hypothetical protein